MSEHRFYIERYGTATPHQWVVLDRTGPFEEALFRAWESERNRTNAEAYAAWRNGEADGPTPKFRVGDRVKFRGGPVSVLTIKAARFRHEYELSEHGGWWHESDLELAPPEPRATVHESDVPNWPKSWAVYCDGAAHYFADREQAEYVAAGLNANPTWTL